MKRPTLAVLAGCALLAACSQGELLRPRSPVPRPARSRAAAPPPRPAPPIIESAPRAANPAGADALFIVPFFQELLLLPDAAPAALAYQFELEQGERLEVDVRAEDGAPLAAVELHADRTDGYERVLEARSGEPFTFDAPVASRYLLRVVAGSGGGRYRVQVRGPQAEVAFPVAGADAAAIGSGWGSDRDEGIRRHEGVDIFAPRGTPVLSVAECVVERVETTRAGGRVIWARDDARALTYYYAHLETQRVRPGERVAPGDTIGTVGNSGNARGSSPHLHFGVYRPGVIAVNPLPLLGRGPADLLLLADTAAALLGRRAETTGSDVRLRAGPQASAPILAELPAGTALRITGVLGDWRRVSLEDGRAGFVAGWLLQPEPLENR